ncbi:MAG: hypothetical protein DRR06_18785 [Gammaproteobacteria bacterium]|nr:MAG: hypothetical protein DRR06_18785 [Gammaproteobacteria bacterium]
MDELAIVITMEAGGRMHLEVTLPKELVKENDDNATVNVDIPIPRLIAPAIGTALIKAANDPQGIEGQISH